MGGTGTVPSRKKKKEDRARYKKQLKKLWLPSPGEFEKEDLRWLSSLTYRREKGKGPEVDVLASEKEREKRPEEIHLHKISIPGAGGGSK